ncbi:MAG TPA: hypothetical protein DCP53_00230 [Elusimicrobia bacterium]|nr:hypothetical protein [Elusimicrobiota bacterium]
MENNIKLSICIPTYNRAYYLKQCLETLIPQVKSRKDVEVIIGDNFSSDNTNEVIMSFKTSDVQIRNFRNNENMGYTGNQIKCFENASGRYIAILCDDDVYLDGEVEEILSVISKRDYAYIALNYYSFFYNYKRPYKVDFAPEKDIIFEKALNILNYPTVGHYSAIVLNAKLAKKYLAELIGQGKHIKAEKSRGIITGLYIRLLAKTDLPAYFIGKRKLAARIPEVLDYDLLRHLCVDYYDMYYEFYKDGLISREDLNFRIGLILAMLPKAIIKDLHKLDDKEVKRITEKLIDDLKYYSSFKFISLPLLFLGRFKTIRYFYRLISFLVDIKRKIIRRIKG